MPNPLADQFTAALAQLEKTRDVNPLAELFSEDAEIGNVLAPEKFHGPEGARDFWKKYRDTFETLESTFRNSIDAGDRIALEWTTQGSSSASHQLSYDGVSILETSNGKITRFRAYFDAAALGRQLES